jgi:hypothetical protein
MSKRKRRKSSFVPKIIFGTLFAGVVPAVVPACGGDDTTSSDSTGQAGFAGVGAGGFRGVAVAAVGAAFSDAAPDVFAGVGAGGFRGVAVGVAGYAGSVGVARQGFAGNDGGPSDAAKDAPTDQPVDQTRGAGGFLAVAVDAFGIEPDAAGKKDASGPDAKLDLPRGRNGRRRGKVTV